MPWRREWLPTPVLLPGASHGQRSLAGNSLWGHRDSDMTEQLILSLPLSIVSVYSASFNWALNPRDITSRLGVPCLENISLSLSIFICNVFFWKSLTIQVKMQRGYLNSLFSLTPTNLRAVGSPVLRADLEWVSIMNWASPGPGPTRPTWAGTPRGGSREDSLLFHCDATSQPTIPSWDADFFVLWWLANIVFHEADAFLKLWIPPTLPGMTIQTLHYGPYLYVLWQYWWFLF